MARRVAADMLKLNTDLVQSNLHEGDLHETNGLTRVGSNYAKRIQATWSTFFT